MHPDPAFRFDNRAVHEAMIFEIGFGMVFATTPDGPRVAHTPIVPAGQDRMRFHLSNGNALTPHLPGATVLLLVNGPDAYVSPRWYSDRGEVPTWNYVALEMEGAVRQLEPGELADLLGEIGAREEGRLGGADGWRPDHVPTERWGKLFTGITGFEMAVSAWRPTFKLSQNKTGEDRARVADALDAEGSPALAKLMRGLAG